MLEKRKAAAINGCQDCSICRWHFELLALRLPRASDTLVRNRPNETDMGYELRIQFVYDALALLEGL